MPSIVEVMSNARAAVLLVEELSSSAKDWEMDHGNDALMGLAQELNSLFGHGIPATHLVNLSRLFQAMERSRNFATVGAGSDTWLMAYRPSERVFKMSTIIENKRYAVAELMGKVALTFEQAFSEVRTQLGSDEEELILPEVPDPEPAPYEFAIVERRIVIVDQPEELSAISEKAQLFLLEESNRLLERLAISNSPHVLAELEELQKRIREVSNIIALGMQNMSFSAYVSAVAEELSDGLAASLLAYSASVGRYVAQFDDWREFSETAASLELPPLSGLVNLASSVSSVLKDNREVADPIVPSVIDDAVKNLNKNSGKPQAKLALVRIVGNIAIAAVSFLKDRITGTGMRVALALEATAAVVILQQFISNMEVVATYPGLDWVLPILMVLRTKI